MNHWLFKSEPDAFSINDLKQMKNGTDHWDGIRNYQARNLMRDQMKLGDRGFFYHSSCKVPGIVGVVEIVREAYPDHTAWDPESSYFDPKSSPDEPRWLMVDVKFVSEYPQIIRLKDLKQVPELEKMPLLQKGSRLSVQPVTADEWQVIQRLSSTI